MIDWRLIPDFPIYEINSVGDIRHRNTQKRYPGRGTNPRMYYLADPKGKTHRISEEDLLKVIFPKNCTTSS